VQCAPVKRQPKRRCRIPRRPHPDLDFFFGRLERTEAEMRDDPGAEGRPILPIPVTAPALKF
jgi:hypothetical protein